MEKTGPIILIDDDSDDLEIYKQALHSLDVKNKILSFETAEESLEYLKHSTEPCFFILCDVNMPKMDGLELRKQLTKDDQLKLKSIPFIFFSTSDHMTHIFKAYESSVQGYFKKPSDFKQIITLFKSIISYWDISLQPLPNQLLKVG